MNDFYLKFMLGGFTKIINMCIDCLKPRSNKNCGCTEFYVLDCQNSSFVMYEMTALSKIKLHSDAADYFKELPFYNNPSKNQRLNA